MSETTARAAESMRTAHDTAEYDVPSYAEWDRAQPYATWASARARTAVQPVPPGMGGSRPGHHVLRYAEAEEVLRDPETFSSRINMEHIGQFHGEMIVGMDGAEHRAYRNLVAHAFRASKLEHWGPDLIEPVITDLLDRIAPLGKADLVADVTGRYPVQVILTIAGVPRDDHERFAVWAEHLNLGPLDPPRGFAAKDAMRAYLKPIIEARRAQPTGDLISEIVHAEIPGPNGAMEKLPDERIYGFLGLLLPAGAETTFRAMGNCLYALLTHPEALARVYADRSLLHNAVEETLRWESSVTMVSRVATRDTVVGGCPIAAGAPVGVITASCNRDEARYENPDEWDLDRPLGNLMTFGTGPHQCLGMHLARLELRAGLSAILDRLPNLRLDPAVAHPEIVGYPFRGPATLPVLFG